MSDDNLGKNFLMIEYPGLVKNDENMLKTMGGMRKLSAIFDQEKRRLEVKFRPNDLFAKPAMGDKFTTNGLLLKIKIKRKKNSSEKPKCEHEILGQVDTVYRFNSLCDFQYLAIHKDNKMTESKIIYKDILPDELKPASWLNEIDDTPYFMPPVSFTRVDNVQDNLFKKEDSITNANLIESTRCKRSKHTKFLTFDLNTPIPMKPHPSAVEYLKTQVASYESFNTVKELFDKRPVWSRMALIYEANVSKDQLKHILPAVGYYYTSGPWRIMWLRFGYDPRKNFESRYFQTFDFRVRNTIGMKSRVETKMIKKNKPNINQTQIKNTKLIDPTTLAAGTNIDESKPQPFLYKPYYEYGELPETRITFFQYCDMHVPKIQEMLDKIPTPSSGAVCNEKTGWLPSGFDELCRDIITHGMKERYQKELADKENDNEYESDYKDEAPSEIDDDDEEEDLDYK